MLTDTLCRSSRSVVGYPVCRYGPCLVSAAIAATPCHPSLPSPTLSILLVPPPTPVTSKLWALLELCHELGVDVGPMRVVGDLHTSHNSHTSHHGASPLPVAAGAAGSTLVGVGGNSTPYTAREGTPGSNSGSGGASAGEGGGDGGDGSVGEEVWIVPLLSWYNCTFDEADPS